jgi:hypothetical protein
MGEDAVEIKNFRKNSLAIAGLMGQGSELQENFSPKKIPIPIKEWGFMKKNSATTYSPTKSPWQYHRR